MRIKLPSVWSSRCTVKVPALTTLVSGTKSTLRMPSGTMKRSCSAGAFMVRALAVAARGAAVAVSSASLEGNHSLPNC